MNNRYLKFQRGFGECGLKYIGSLFWLRMKKGKQKDKIPSEKNVTHNHFPLKMILFNILCPCSLPFTTHV